MHKNENRPGYKNSKVGWIPEGWNSFPLKTLTSHIGDGIHTTPDYVEKSDYYFINGNNLVDGRVSISGQTKCVSKEEFVKHHRELNSRTLLLSINGTIGSVAYFNEESVILGKSAAYINCCDRLNKTFAFCFLNSRKTSSFFRGELTGSTIQNLSLASIRLLPMALPPLPEQKAIAGVLECWERGISNLELKIEKKRLIKNGLMQRLLSGKQRLKGFYKEWKCVRLGEVTTPRKERIDSRQQGIQTFCVDLEHIAPETGKLLGHTSAGDNASLKTVFQRGDILFGKLRAYLRKYWLADQTGVCSTEIWVLPPNKMLTTSQYLFQIIKTDLFIDASNSTTGTHMPRSDWDTVKNYTFGLPPLDEQKAIAGVLSAADSEIEALEKKLALWKEQKKHLLNNLVTGTIRLPQFCVKA